MSENEAPIPEKPPTKNFYSKREVSMHPQRPKFAVVMSSPQHKYDFMFIAEYDTSLGELVTIINRQTINSVAVVNCACIKSVIPMGILNQE